MVKADGNVLVANETKAQQLARAKGYPYPRPDTSFLFIGGDVFLFDNIEWQGLQGLDGIKGRDGTTAAEFAAARGIDLKALANEHLYWPVLAIGSNAGPEQLRRKYPAELYPTAVIPVIQVALEGFDVVYTPYMASYGSCTATLEPSPGTTVSIFVTYLTAELMERMHATEGGYNLVQLGGLAMHVAPRGPASAGAAKDAGSGAHAGAGRHMGAGEPCFELRSWAYQYNHKLGCIELPLAGGGGSPIAIAEIPATGRRFPAATQTQMLAALRVALGDEPAEGGELKPVPAPGSSAVAGAGSAEAQDLDAWILAVVNNPTKQRRACKRLALHARAFEYPQAEVVAAL